MCAVQAMIPGDELTAQDVANLVDDRAALYLVYVECAAQKSIGEETVYKYFRYFEAAYTQAQFVDDGRSLDEKVRKTMLVVLASCILVGAVQKGDKIPDYVTGVLKRTYKESSEYYYADRFPYVFWCLRKHLGDKLQVLLE